MPLENNILPYAGTVYYMTLAFSRFFFLVSGCLLCSFPQCSLACSSRPLELEDGDREG